MTRTVNSTWDIFQSGVKGKYVACTNPHSLVVAQSDSHFRRALAKADILLPDGSGIVLAAKILGLDLTERVAGSEFFEELTSKAEKMAV